MERYGYLLLDSSSTYYYIHYDLYRNLFDCVRSALSALDKETKKILCYFKILNNVEIVQSINEENDKPRFGVCSVHRLAPHKQFSVCGSSQILHSNILLCIESANDFLSQVGLCYSNQIPNFRIEYFQILNDDDIVFCLKRTVLTHEV